MTLSHENRPEIWTPKTVFDRVLPHSCLSYRTKLMSRIAMRLGVRCIQNLLVLAIACTMSITFRDFVPQTYMHVEIRGNSEL